MKISLIGITLGALLVAACTSSAKPSERAASSENVSLHFKVSDGEGHSAQARLHCVGNRVQVVGYLKGDALTLCAKARELAEFLASEPDPNRICTEIYGGPDTAHIQGEIGARSIDRRLGRRDGCEIADWKRVEEFFAGAPRSSFRR